MYYAMIFASVAMFGGCFALNDLYRQRRGSGLKISMESAFVGSVAGLVFLLIINKFLFEFTPFTLIMGMVAAINGLLFTFCSFKALGSINLSMYSLFSMLGGMLLPFFQGILFYGEKITVAKVVCVVLICVSLALTVTRGKGKKGYIYYAGVFVLNGMSGVLTKLYNELPYEKTSAAGYTFWIAACTLVLSGVIWLLLSIKSKKNENRYTFKDLAIGAGNGGLSRIANFLLVIALTRVDTSVQYPAVTGGVIIASTLICFFSDRKPSRRELISVILAFAGTLALFAIPV